MHVVGDLTIASKEHAIFKQTDADVASFDGGFGSAYLLDKSDKKEHVKYFFRSRLFGTGSLRDGDGEQSSTTRKTGTNHL